MQELEIFVSGLFKLFFYVSTLWAAYRIGKISGIEENMEEIFGCSIR